MLYGVGGRSNIKFGGNIGNEKGFRKRISALISSANALDDVKNSVLEVRLTK